MKKETFLRGHDLTMSIESVQKLKAKFGIANNIELRGHNSGRLIDIYPENGRIKQSGDSKIPEKLRELINEEAIHFLQRCKRHCDNAEHKFKQEFEDLNDDYQVPPKEDKEVEDEE